MSDEPLSISLQAGLGHPATIVEDSCRTLWIGAEHLAIQYSLDLSVYSPIRHQITLELPQGRLVFECSVLACRPLPESRAYECILGELLGPTKKLRDFYNSRKGKVVVT